MIRSWLLALRFATAWQRRSSRAAHRDVEVNVSGESVPASLYLPEGGSDPPGSWILLHGLTRPGRFHPAMVRFARALAATHARVLIPEIPAWRDLRLAPDRTLPTVQGAVAYLEADSKPDDLSGPGRGSPGPHAEGSRKGRKPVLVGFSFGGPQALVAGADPSVRDRLGGIVAWGGYHDLEKTFHFQMCGEFQGEYRGKPLAGRLPPDPYGRWMVASTCLTLAPRYRDAEDVARALRRLATEAGDRKIPADSAELDPLREALRKGIDPARRPLFDLLAPPTGQSPSPEEARELASGFLEHVHRKIPLLDPGPRLRPVPAPIRLLHARSDRLVPYTETLALAQALEGQADLSVSVIGLLGHSGGNAATSVLGRAFESLGFLRALRRVMELG